MKTWTNNRIAWAVCALAAVVVLLGAGILGYRATAGPAPFYHLGIQRGREDAAADVDVGPAMEMDAPTALLYRGMLPALIEATQTPSDARWSQVRQASVLAERAFRAAPEQQKRYMRAFVAGYRLGHSLKPRTTRTHASPKVTTGNGTGPS